MFSRAVLIAREVPDKDKRRHLETDFRDDTGKDNETRVLAMFAPDRKLVQTRRFRRVLFPTVHGVRVPLALETWHEALRKRD